MRTRKPFTWVITYGGHNGHLANPEPLLTQVRAAPPHLLHIGHDTPLPNSFGPFEVRDGTLVRLTPEHALKRTAAIEDMLQRFRQTGVQVIIPYICNQTIAGDAERRLGIWEFYDHWDEYAEMGIGPRPDADPNRWLARERNGRPHFNYEMRHEGFLRMGLLRWAPCCNNPYYNAWQRAVVSQIARVGYNGVFVDNCNLNCYCEHCQAKFRAYLQNRYSSHDLRGRFGIEDAAQLPLAHRGSRFEWVKEASTFREFLHERLSDEELARWLGTADLEVARIEEGGNGWLWGRAREYRKWMEERYSPGQLEDMFGAADLSEWGVRDAAERLLWAETKRFWGHSVRENLQFVKQVGLEASVAAGKKADFIVVPNWGEMANVDATEFREEIAHDIAAWAPGMDLMMFEEGNMAGQITGGLYLDHVLQHKYAGALGVNAAVLPYGRAHEGSVELAYAEAVANGGAAHIQIGVGFPEVRRRYGEFFERHAGLLQDAEPYAQVWVACLMDELHLENPQHLDWVYRVTRYLADQHVLFDVLTESQLTAEALREKPTVVLVETRHLSEEQMGALEAYVKRGGLLVMAGEVGTHDEKARRRFGLSLPRMLGISTLRRHGVFTSFEGRCLWATNAGWLIGPSRVSREDSLEFANYAEASINVPTGRAEVVYELDRVVGVDRYTRQAELIARLEQALSRELRLAHPYDAMGVRFSAYQKQIDGEPAILLHMVNYNVPLTEHPRGLKVRPLAEVEVALPLPAEWAGARVALLEPGAEEQEVPGEVQGASLRFTVPSLSVYKVALVRRAGG